MATVVILPGGFHPYHAGHYALYQSARRTFPDADVYVAATDDRSQRPFPFAIKEKLAELAGVEPGHFVQVRSPFQAQEITKNYNPEQDVVIFVRSTKDAKQPPIPGGVKKDGKPAYLQPLLGAKKLDTFNKHAYMAYLPTVEFGPGITSASEIRAAWPSLDERKKTAMVMSLYPRTQGNPKLAATVRKMLDTAIGSGADHDVVETVDVDAIHAESLREHLLSDPPLYENRDDYQNARKFFDSYKTPVPTVGESYVYASVQATPIANYISIAHFNVEHELVKLDAQYAYFRIGGTIKRFPEHSTLSGDSLSAIYFFNSKKEFDHFDTMLKLKFANSKQTSKVLDQASANESHTVGYIQEENPDYIEEKWSEKYKRSINCNNPRGFSQRAHCAGRKK